MHIPSCNCTDTVAFLSFRLSVLSGRTTNKKLLSFEFRLNLPLYLLHFIRSNSFPFLIYNFQALITRKLHFFTSFHFCFFLLLRFLFLCLFISLYIHFKFNKNTKNTHSQYEKRASNFRGIQNPRVTNKTIQYSLFSIFFEYLSSTFYFEYSTERRAAKTKIEHELCCAAVYIVAQYSGTKRQKQRINSAEPLCKKNFDWLLSHIL